MLAGQAHAVGQEPRMDEPTLAVGDMWTYAIEMSGKPRQFTTIVVTEVEENTYTMRTITPEGRYETAAYPRQTTAVGNVGMNWPLSVGQHWTLSDTVGTPRVPIKSDITVDAFELLTIPAGTLGAFRVAIRICTDVPEGQCGTMRLWIAPRAKTVAKWEVGREDIWRNAGGTDIRGNSFTLVAYAVAPSQSPNPVRFSVVLASRTSPVSPGSMASITVKTAPGAVCTITVTYMSGPSRAQGLEPKEADTDGVVSWTWRVGTQTTPGEWPITVVCSTQDSHATLETSFIVR
jgi:micrococcal nuclease